MTAKKEYFAIRGILEGFYGRPWSWAERYRMVEFLADNGYNLYVYGPKNDPVHRNRWLEPYLPEEVARFGKLNQLCAEKGVELVFGVSPLHFHYTDQAHFETLWAKVRTLYEAGVRSFCVLLDDMPDKFRYSDDGERFRSIADAQAWLVNALRGRLNEAGGFKKLTFCPTEYHGAGVSDYLKTLGRVMAPEVEIFWTGREICSPVLKTEDAKTVSATLRRPVLYWDNYPVNDLDMRVDPHIRPLRGRDTDLWTACRGIVVNAALQPEASKIALHTYAQYMADPQGYEPEQAWGKALLAVTGNFGDAAAVAALGDLNVRSCLERGKELQNFLLPKLQDFWHRWGGVPALAGPDLPGIDVAHAAGTGAPDRQTALDELNTEFMLLRGVAERLLSEMQNPYLQAELRPWSTKLMGWVEVAEAGLALLRLALQNPHDSRIPAMRERIVDRILIVRENFHWVAGDMVDQFARRCCWAATELANEGEAR